MSLEVIAESLDRIRTDVVRRTERAFRVLDRRRRHLVAAVERRAGGLLEAASKGLNIASRSDVAALNARLATLERRLHNLAAKETSGAQKAVAG